MFDDAATTGVDEFIQVVTEYCSVQENKEEIYHFKVFTVSYEVIELFLEHQELIGMLANCHTKLYCLDNRSKQEEISKFRHVINPLK